ncbi:unnamed protein product [Vitrella brassicaformis CCMP3155]|uniref:Sodium/calcium exchanger membrane region domain-containing protein n=2 Tax=Vitrella brassicaformis TaxID=1169539 RepID=A0A0G4EKR6_VITBC|nr:unnamed protein product [Vitrella brassicaformis CCMP3155]|mmetsp:Transcript_30288/g.75226  ORF Transcript_30288/g.75226 Transcript_30288/m.75226 type:complete len:441 (+) Transcript_30288:44-1366(+)|eukprot:CEL97751.1 unnamed protein product [Vitrella brassicaformis CCMP3155]
MAQERIRASSFIRKTCPASMSMSGPSLVALRDESARSLLVSERKVFTWRSDASALKDMIFNDSLNLLLVAVPLGVVASSANWGSFWIFALNFVALVPLAKALGSATEELALHVGEILGGLLNATFGNAVELILTVQSLRQGLIAVVQGTLLGSILSNMLLVLGMSFFFGGIYHHVQTFNVQGATSCTSLLLLSVLGMALTSCFHEYSTLVQESSVLTVSRIAAVVMLLTYVLFIYFQLRTHRDLFSDDKGGQEDDQSAADIDELGDVANLSWVSAVFLLAVVTLIIAMNSDYLVGSIEGIVTEWGVPEDFIGVILLPIVGNAAEHLTAVTVAMKNKPDLTIGVAIGSSTQIALFAVPVAVIAGWLMDQPMTLDFNTLEATALALSVLVVQGVLADGQSNWLEGVMLMSAYFVIACIFWYVPAGVADETMQPGLAAAVPMS